MKEDLCGYKSYRTLFLKLPTLHPLVIAMRTAQSIPIYVAWASTTPPQLRSVPNSEAVCAQLCVLT